MAGVTKTIYNIENKVQRVTLPEPFWSGKNELGPGVYLTAIYRGQRTGRMFIETYSIWASARNDGTTVGTRVHEVDESDFLRSCEVAGVTPPVAPTVID